MAKIKYSAEEEKILQLIRTGTPKTRAYKDVMLTKDDLRNMRPATIKRRIERFFSTRRMKLALLEIEGKQGDAERAEYEKELAEEKKAAEKRFKDLFGNPDKEIKEIEKPDPEMMVAWKEAIDPRGKVSEKEHIPGIMIWGSGRVLFSLAFEEILARRDEIKKRGLSPLAHSYFSAGALKALNLAYMQVLPWAPPPTAKDTKDASLMVALLNAVENIKESPDDFTAPPPASVQVSMKKAKVVDVEREDK